MRPLRALFLADNLKLGHFKRTEYLLDRLLDVSRDRGDLLFYQGELFRLRNGPDDMPRAMRSLLDASLERDAPPEVFCSLGFLHGRMGDTDKAKKCYARYLSLRPDAPDRAVLEQKIHRNETPEDAEE